MSNTPNDILIKANLLIQRQLAQRDRPIELTNEDKFAIAFAVGVETHFETDYDGWLPAQDTTKIKAITVPCGIAWDGDKFCVFTGQ